MKPMMSDQEIKIVDDILTTKKPRHCLEWGSGISTVYFPRKHRSVRWLAVEHNGNYVIAIAPLLPDNSSVIWTPDNEWYVDSVKHSRVFDFILIDGLQRERCLEIAKEIIRPGGTILLHDSGREEYQEFIKKHNGEILCDGEKRVGDYFAHRGLARFK